MLIGGREDQERQRLQAAVAKAVATEVAPLTTEIAALRIEIAAMRGGASVPKPSLTARLKAKATKVIESVRANL